MTTLSPDLFSGDALGGSDCWCGWGRGFALATAGAAGVRESVLLATAAGTATSVLFLSAARSGEAPEVPFATTAVPADGIAPALAAGAPNLVPFAVLAAPASAPVVCVFASVLFLEAAASAAGEFVLFPSPAGATCPARDVLLAEGAAASVLFTAGVATAAAPDAGTAFAVPSLAISGAGVAV